MNVQEMHVLYTQIDLCLIPLVKENKWPIFRFGWPHQLPKVSRLSHNSDVVMMAAEGSSRPGLSISVVTMIS